MSGPGGGRALGFELVDGGALTIEPGRLVIAGYTGRDQSAVRAHIEELARIGVPPPPSVPMFYEVPIELVTTEPSIQVDGPATSGEVEPVILRWGGNCYVGLGSDHTDRDIEKRDVRESKASAAKPVGRRLLELDSLLDGWDECRLRCTVDGQPYQEGFLSGLMTPAALIEALEASGDEFEDGTLMFCGTLPLLTGSFTFGARYELELTTPNGRSLSHTYDVRSPSGVAR